MSDLELEPELAALAERLRARELPARPAPGPRLAAALAARGRGGARAESMRSIGAGAAAAAACLAASGPLWLAADPHAERAVRPAVEFGVDGMRGALRALSAFDGGGR